VSLAKSQGPKAKGLLILLAAQLSKSVHVLLSSLGGKLTNFTIFFAYLSSKIGGILPFTNPMIAENSVVT